MRLVVALVSTSAAAGCVEPLGGSNVQIAFHEEVPVPARPGQMPGAHQPPANTHLVLYATDYIYTDADDDGKPDVDADGRKIVESSWVFEVKQFELQPVIDVQSPCFIDGDGTPFPGVHVTRFAEKLQLETGISDPFAPDQDPLLVQDVLGAQRRVGLLLRIQSDIKGVTSYGGNSPYPVIDLTSTDCGGELPPPACIDDESNTRRLATCKRYWAEHPDYYEGSDRVFSLPLNGTLFGVAEAEDPRNGGNIGGAGFYIPLDLAGADDFFLNWQYNDEAMNASLPRYGEPFMQGTSLRVSRGVINARLTNLDDSRITAELAVFPNLAQDDVNF